MNPAEHEILYAFVKEQRIFNKNIMDEVLQIKRGVYGDELNGVKGLIQRQADDEREIKNLKAFRSKMIWTGSGLVVGIQAVIEWIKFKSK